MAEPETLLRIKEVAEALKVSTKTVRRLISLGEIPAVWIGGSSRVLQSDLDQYIKRAKRRYQ